jgi:cysteine desulfurase
MKPALPIYLDWNATTPPHPSVIAAMLEASETTWANPSSVHTLGRHAKERIEQVRVKIAQYLQVNSRDLLFTSGGTEANNLALFDAPGLVTSRLEHASVTRVAETLESSGIPVRWLPITRFGQIDLSSVSEAISSLPVGSRIAVQAVNHETGVIQPLQELSILAQRYGAYLHVDAVQALGKLKPESWLHGDSFAIAAHKVRGPKGLGALGWRCGRPVPKPLLRGGSQQRGFRPGTLDPNGILGFGASCERLGGGPERLAAVERLRNRLESSLSGLVEPNVYSTAPDVNRLGHVSSLFVPGWRGEEVVAALDLEGICISSGSACSAGTAEASSVITAMYDVERALGTVRVSLGEETTDAEIDYTIEAFRRVLTRR